MNAETPRVKAIIFSLNSIVQMKNDQLIDGVDKYLKKLKNEGYQLAVYGKISKNLIEKVLSNLDLRKYFQVVVSDEEVVKKFPYPHLLNKVLENLNVRSGEVVLIENDRLAIVAAYMRRIRVFALVENKEEYLKVNRNGNKILFMFENYQEVISSDLNELAKIRTVSLPGFAIALIGLVFVLGVILLLIAR